MSAPAADHRTGHERFAGAEFRAEPSAAKSEREFTGSHGRALSASLDNAAHGEPAHRRDSHGKSPSGAGRFISESTARAGDGAFGISCKRTSAGPGGRCASVADRDARLHCSETQCCACFSCGAGRAADGLEDDSGGCATAPRILPKAWRIFRGHFSLMVVRWSRTADRVSLTPSRSISVD